MSQKRSAQVERTTAETKIHVEWTLDGRGRSNIKTGIGFFDHLLTAMAKHGFFDLQVTAEGDLHVDAHHTVEDVGIVMGQAFAKALSDGQGMTRFGDAWVPMDEALLHAALDISGRPFLHCQLSYPQERVGTFDSILLQEFLRAFVQQAGITLHVRQLAGENSHHILEAAAKAVARALAAALTKHPKVDGVLSTKDWLELGTRTEESQ